MSEILTENLETTDKPECNEETIEPNNLLKSGEDKTTAAAENNSAVEAEDNNEKSSQSELKEIVTQETTPQTKSDTGNTQEIEKSTDLENKSKATEISAIRSNEKETDIFSNDKSSQSQLKEIQNQATTPQTSKPDTKEAQDIISNPIANTENVTADDLKDISAIKTNEEVRDTPSQDQYAEHVTYTSDGTAIYTDPKTNFKYKWCTKTNYWIPNDISSTTSANLYENEHYKWCKESQKWIPKQTLVTETEHYKWDSEKNQWIAKVKSNSETKTVTEQTNLTDIVYDIDEDGQRTYTDKDGTVFFWDVEKNAWFPKIDDDFMARYQMNYGFIDNTSASEKEKEKLELEKIVEKEKEFAKMVEEAKENEEAANNRDNNKQGLKRKGHQEPPKWFEIDPEHNTKVYVSNLPLDITLDEFAELMGKCGMIMRDPQTQKYKLKLYTETDGQIKGDGLCDYIKVESVGLALNILDEYDLRGHKIRVQPAKFQMRGEYNPALKPKRKKKDKEKLAKIKEKLFDWRPEKMRGERSKHERTVIIKNLFHPEIFEKEVQLILDYQNDLREECSKCGTVRKVIIYDRHTEGVAQINMSTPEEADMVIQMMHGRFFGKRQLTADHWDGKTKYKVEETEEEIQKRLNKWDQYLETEENKKAVLQQNEKEKDLTETETANGE